MGLPPYLIVQQGHLSMFVVNPEQHLVRSCCRFCGATTEPIDASDGCVTENFLGVPHVRSCLVIGSSLILDEHERRVA